MRHLEYAQPPGPCAVIQFDRGAIRKPQRVRRIVPDLIGHQAPIHKLGSGVVGVGVGVEDVFSAEVAYRKRQVPNVLCTAQFEWRVIGGFLLPTEADRLANKSAADVGIRISLADSKRLAIWKPRHTERVAQAVSLPDDDVPEKLSPPPQAYAAHQIHGHGVFDLDARLKAVQTRIFSGERRVALSANRRLDVQIPRLAIWRRRLGRVLALVRRRTVLAARGGDGHGEKKQHRPQPSKPHHAPHCALPVHECIDSNHAITASSEIALKSKRPRERKLHRGDP